MDTVDRPSDSHKRKYIGNNVYIRHNSICEIFSLSVTVTAVTLKPTAQQSSLQDVSCMSAKPKADCLVSRKTSCLDDACPTLCLTAHLFHEGGATNIWRGVEPRCGHAHFEFWRRHHLLMERR